jgi:hypothetical protein
MAGRFRARFSVPAGDVQRLMDCIVDNARPDEEREVERVLGALVTLTASDPGSDDVIEFSPPPGTVRLVERALAAMARSDRHEARARRTRSASAA